jgi:hypothetical protein
MLAYNYHELNIGTGELLNSAFFRKFNLKGLKAQCPGIFVFMFFAQNNPEY